MDKEISKKDFEQKEQTELKIKPSESMDQNKASAIFSKIKAKFDIKIEVEVRPLTDSEKKVLQEKLGWSEDKINSKCTIDKNETIHYKTDRCDLEGSNSENDIEYVRKTIYYNDVKIEGVFPVFESKFDMQLNPEDYQKSNTKQFSEANKALKTEIENNPELEKQFTKEQLEDIKNGDTPRGYTWHHNEEPGKMQLVKTSDHDRTIGGAAHTGGNSIWGNESISKNKEGVSF